jgi:hypothetical protein
MPPLRGTVEVGPNGPIRGTNQPPSGGATPPGQPPVLRSPTGQPGAAGRERPPLAPPAAQKGQTP